jgi:hypothetical protein
MPGWNILYWGTVVTCLCLGFVLGLAVGVDPAPPGGTVPSTGSWLFDWQGLIAGCLAVVATVVTVSAMIAAEARSERRHRETFGQSLSADLRKLDRAIDPHGSDLRGLCKQVLDLRVKHDGPPPKTTFNDEECTSIGEVVGNIALVFDSRALAEAADLFPPRLAVVFDEMQEKDRMMLFVSTVLMPDSHTSITDMSKSDVALEALQELFAMHPRLVEFADGLVALRDEYAAGTQPKRARAMIPAS